MININNPRLSIIIPCYNVDRYISRCIESVLKQSFKDFELIIIDDGSTDDTAEIIDRFTKKDDRIRYARKDNAGPSSARNLGIKLAKGEWVTFVDADDEIGENYICDFFLYEPDAYDFVMQGLTELYSDKVRIRPVSEEKTVWNRVCVGIENIKLLHKGHSVGKLYNRMILSANDIYFDLRWKYKEDLMFCLKYLKYVRRIVALPGSSYRYYHNPDSLTSRKWDVNYLIDNTLNVLSLIKEIEVVFDDTISSDYKADYLCFCIDEQIESLYAKNMSLKDRITCLNKIRNLPQIHFYPIKYRSDKVLSVLFRHRMWYLYDLLKSFILNLRKGKD